MNARQTNSVTRRQFFARTGTAVVAAKIAPRHVRGGPKFVAPSAKVNLAIVGAGGQGRTLARALFEEPDAQIIAVADRNEQADYSRFYFKGVAGRKPVKAEIEKHYAERTPNFRCAEHEDFRVMLEKEKAIDAIVCCTPDHAHAVVSIRSKGHQRDWLEACKGGQPASSNFEYAARLTEIVLLGNVALRVGKKITWDGPNLKATNAPEAEQFIEGTYRSGCEIG